MTPAPKRPRRRRTHPSRWTYPLQDGEITDAMIEPIRASMNRPLRGLAQTLWPSRNYGPDYIDSDRLLTSGVALLLPGEPPEAARPRDAADGSMPFFTILPDGWWGPPIGQYPRDRVLAPTAVPRDPAERGSVVCAGCGRRPPGRDCAWNTDQDGDWWCGGCRYRMAEAGLIPSAGE